MRIISQDRMTDIPYDNAVVYINRQMPTQIYVCGLDSDEGFLIGIYDTTKDAVYIMELIKTAFTYGNQYFYMPKDKNVSMIRAKTEGSE